MKGHAAPSASAQRLVLAAERLFALYGIDGVSLRKIAAEAGSGNTSAVHYHFGSKQRLLTAIFAHRLPRIVGERKLLATRCDPQNLRSVIEAHFLPVFHLAESDGCHYVSFVERISEQAVAAGVSESTLLSDLPEEGRRSTEAFRSALNELLAHLDERLRGIRINDAERLCVHAAADRERARQRDVSPPPFELYVSCFFDSVTSFLSAPISRATVDRLTRAGDVASPGLAVL